MPCVPSCEFQLPFSSPNYSSACLFRAHVFMKDTVHRENADNEERKSAADRIFRYFICSVINLTWWSKHLMESSDKIRMNFITALLEPNNVLYIEPILSEFTERLNERWKLYYRMSHHFRILDNIEVHEWAGLHVTASGFRRRLSSASLCFTSWSLMVYPCTAWSNLPTPPCHFRSIGTVCILPTWNMTGLYGSAKSHICPKLHYLSLL